MNKPLPNDKIEYHFDINDDAFINLLLNEKEQTAEIIQCSSKEPEIIIPRSITYKSKEYIITNIKSFSFINIHISIKFSADSELQTIEKDASQSSNIGSILIPSSVNDLQIGWYGVFSCISKITISPNNSQFKH